MQNPAGSAPLVSRDSSACFLFYFLGEGARNSAPKCCTFLTWFGKPLRLVDIFQWGGYDSGPTLAPAAQCVGGRRSGQTKFQIFSSDPWGLLKRFTAGILMPQRNPEEANLNPKLNLSVQAQEKKCSACLNILPQ